METNKTYTLITGSTSGIGYELAKIFADNGHNLILVSRDEADLTITRNELLELGVEVLIISKDIFDRQILLIFIRRSVKKDMTWIY